MINSLRGIVCEKGPDSAVLEVGGIGFSVGMSGHGVASLPPIGQEAYVLTCLVVREDSLSLYGFVDSNERALFQSLIEVSGIGPKVALAALSTYSAAELVDAITSGDVKRVSAVPGIGKKTAQRIVLELKGALVDEQLSQPMLDMALPEGVIAEAASALLAMGFTTSEAQAALSQYHGDSDDVGDVVRYALKRLGSS
jgi:Holliday junction DNA helicase RuvA